MADRNLTISISNSAPESPSSQHLTPDAARHGRGFRRSRSGSISRKNANPAEMGRLSRAASPSGSTSGRSHIGSFLDNLRETVTPRIRLGHWTDSFTNSISQRPFCLTSLVSQNIDGEHRFVSSDDETRGLKFNEVMDHFLSLVRKAATKAGKSIDRALDGKVAASLEMPLEFYSSAHTHAIMFSVEMPVQAPAEGSLAARWAARKSAAEEAGSDDHPRVSFSLAARELTGLFGEDALNPRNSKLRAGYRRLSQGHLPRFSCDDKQLEEDIDEVLQNNPKLCEKVRNIFGGTALKTKEVPPIFGDDPILQIPGAPRFMGAWGNSLIFSLAVSV